METDGTSQAGSLPGRRGRPDGAADRGQAGFTLIEFLVVVGVMAILGGIVVFSVGRARDNAAKNACQTERSTFETAANAASIDPAATMSNYLKDSTGVYFEVTGPSSYSRLATSQY
ncbi:MAG: type II secretion system protein, partial [Microthrixaceae bacterium]